MLYNLNPMDVRPTFARRQYLIDDTIRATATLLPNGSVKFRRASLNLVAQARLTEAMKGKSTELRAYPAAISFPHGHPGRGQAKNAISRQAVSR